MSECLNASASILPSISKASKDAAASKLELGEGLLGAGRFGHLQGVVLHSLAQGPALSDSEGITNGSVSEARGEVDRDVLVPLLKPVVFLDIVKVIPPDDGGPVHLQLGHHTGEDTATDGPLSGEGTLFVNVVTHTSLSWGLEA